MSLIQLSRLIWDSAHPLVNRNLLFLWELEIAWLCNLSVKTSLMLDFYWYKQNVGQELKLISTFYMFERNGTVHNEFNHNPRFMLDTETGQNHLKVTNVHISDSATYYCASYLYRLEFAAGTKVSVEGSGFKIQTLVHQSASEMVHTGGSVTLNCTVQTGSCDGEHKVQKLSWISSRTHLHPWGMNDQCKRNHNTQTHPCESILSIKNLDVSHPGTYYCAIVSCGHILFGNGTKLGFNCELQPGLKDIFTFNISKQKND